MSGFLPTAEVARQRIPGGDEGDVVIITAGAFHGPLGERVPAFQLRRSDLPPTGIYYANFADANRAMAVLLGQLHQQHAGQRRLDRMADLLG